MSHDENDPAIAGSTGSAEQATEAVIEILECAMQGKDVPHATKYRVRIDNKEVVFDTATPTGDAILDKVGKRSCAFELIEEFVHHKNNVVEPGEKVDLRKKGLKGFVTAHKEIVTIFINHTPHQIERGDRAVSEILSKVGQTPKGHALFEEKDHHSVLLSPDLPVKIQGCEIFQSHVQFEIKIDRVQYEVTSERMTGLQLRHIPSPPVGPDRDLFEVVPGGSDQKIGDEQIVDIRNGLRFFTAPSHINPGLGSRM